MMTVLRNLLGNAWKYTSRTQDASIRFYTEQREGKTWYCVSDNGAGFDMAHADRLFRPFTRLHRQDEFPGHGLGLATVQRIVKRHGGEIVAHAAIKQGATLSFHLRPPPEDR
jgi:light-regulated signal transduction histidine kinase (bacteriophytochrome)